MISRRRKAHIIAALRLLPELRSTNYREWLDKHSYFGPLEELMTSKGLPFATKSVVFKSCQDAYTIINTAASACGKEMRRWHAYTVISKFIENESFETIPKDLTNQLVELSLSKIVEQLNYIRIPIYDGLQKYILDNHPLLLVEMADKLDLLMLKEQNPQMWEVWQTIDTLYDATEKVQRRESLRAWLDTKNETVFAKTKPIDLPIDGFM